MALRERLGQVADRLTARFGDGQQFVTFTSTPGVTEFDPPTLTPTTTTVNAVVTGAQKWADNEIVLQSDLAVLVGASAPRASLGGTVRIDGDDYIIIQVNPILAGGFASAVRYIVRRG